MWWPLRTAVTARAARQQGKSQPVTPPCVTAHWGSRQTQMESQCRQRATTHRWAAKQRLPVSSRKPQPCPSTPEHRITDRFSSDSSEHWQPSLYHTSTPRRFNWGCHLFKTDRVTWHKETPRRLLAVTVHYLRRCKMVMGPPTAPLGDFNQRCTRTRRAIPKDFCPKG